MLAHRKRSVNGSCCSHFTSSHITVHAQLVWLLINEYIVVKNIKFTILTSFKSIVQ